MVSSADEGRDLIRVLAAHGLNAELSATIAGCRVEVRSAREETEALLSEVLRALALWLGDRRRDVIPLRVGELQYTFRPGAARRDALQLLEDLRPTERPPATVGITPRSLEDVETVAQPSTPTDRTTGKKPGAETPSATGNRGTK